MSSAKLAAPSRLERARDRLEKAVAKMEAAVDERQGDLDRAATPPEGANEALAEAKSENRALREANDNLSRRLDDAIDRLKSVLEG